MNTKHLLQSLPTSRWWIFLAVLVAVFVFVKASPAQAITLIPPTLEFNLDPGKPYATVVKLFNEEERTLTLNAAVKNFGPQGETGLPAYELNEPVQGFSSWIQLPDGDLTIEPGERIEVPVSVNPPDNAEPGGHYAAVFFTEKPKTDDKAQVGIGKGIGILLLAKVSGEVVEQGGILEFSTLKETYANLPVEFLIRFQNTGNVHLRPTGTVTITSMFGKVIDTIQINQTKGATLPDSIRKYDGVWQKQGGKTFGSGFFNAYRNEMSNFAFGKYTANLTMAATGLTTVQDMKSVTFWVIPWHVIIVDGIAVIIIIILIVLLIRWYNRWLINRVLKAQENKKADKKAPTKPSDAQPVASIEQKQETKQTKK